MRERERVGERKRKRGMARRREVKVKVLVFKSLIQAEASLNTSQLHREREIETQRDSVCEKILSLHCVYVVTYCVLMLMETDRVSGLGARSFPIEAFWSCTHHLADEQITSQTSNH